MNKKSRCLALVPVLALTGCVGTALRLASTHCSEAYGDAVNRQLLLNLARLSHDEPPYFIQVGQMNSQFTFNTTAGFNSVFALISYLYAQLAIDPQKLPVQQLIQVR